MSNDDCRKRFKRGQALMHRMDMKINEAHWGGGKPTLAMSSGLFQRDVEATSLPKWAQKRIISELTEAEKDIEQGNPHSASRRMSKVKKIVDENIFDGYDTCMGFEDKKRR